MATGSWSPVSFLLLSVLCYFHGFTVGQELTPPYFNLAHGRNISATATCGYGVPGPELYCRLTGSTTFGSSTEIIQGMSCDYCNPNNPEQDHRPEYAIDGTERWWQSPPLSRGVELNNVNLTLSLGQEFHVAYVFIKMANSPRPGVWILERSKDFGKTWRPWQYFADTPSDCVNFFNTTADLPLATDHQVICSTEFSKIVPLSNGEIVVSLVNGRPSSMNFSYADDLQEFTRATDIQLRLMRPRTLMGHVMAISRSDPTVTRRYYYSIKDISIGGRCVCNGHAETCDVRNPATNRLVCVCVHNTCGEMCEYCCPGYTQKKWRRAIVDLPFSCEPCQCHGHSDECIYDEDVAQNRSSIDIHGKYEGGGVCQNCRDNTMGINCEQCVPRYYRPYGVYQNETNACRPCQCDLRVSTGECEQLTGRCFCRPEYAGVNCDRCSFGYYGYPNCIPCECDINGTEDSVCTVESGVCPCKSNYAGNKCNQCALGYYNFPECKACECNQVGSPSTVCDLETGQCQCQENFAGLTCGQCADGYYSFPRCQYCNCDHAGTEDEVCDKDTGTCLCKPNFTTSRCDRCTPGFFNFPVCQECECTDPGSLIKICVENGQCRCKTNYGGQNCERCAPGFYKYPDCTPCNCDVYGSLAQSCDQISGQCRCRGNFVGLMCDRCGENFYNYPMCEVCNCNPDGAKDIPGYKLGGCGVVTVGRLCECKERVIGKICDTCKPGFWNLNRNNPLGCEECTCFEAGTLSHVNQCDLTTGQCNCKPDVTGRNCDRCQDGFYNLQASNPYGCDYCNCDRGGSLRMACDKLTGQCACKPRITGLRCDTPVSGYFIPTLHQYKFEIEDGDNPEGARIRYGYDDRIFPNFSWRGYAILTKVQPEVILNIDIKNPSLYQLIYRYVNRQDNTVKGMVTLSPESPTEIVQNGALVFMPSKDPKFTTVTSDSGQYFVLNPGRWTIRTIVHDDVFLDFFALIPQGYYEPSNLQERIPNPCNGTITDQPCMQIAYPDLKGNPSSNGTEGYTIVEGIRRNASLLPDIELTNTLGSTGLAHINKEQNSVRFDVVVPEPGEYYLTLNYYNPGRTSQQFDVEVATLTGRSNSIATLDSCPFSTTCRQVVKGPDGAAGLFNITSGYASLYITARTIDDINIAIDSIHAIPRAQWQPQLVMPRILCIKINGVCASSSYGRPVGSVRIEFEHSPNEEFLSKNIPPYISDQNVGLVNLNDTIKIVEQTVCPLQGAEITDECETEEVVQAVPLELHGRVTKPGQYIFVVHYYMPTEPGLSVPVTIYVDGKASAGVFNPHFCPSVVGCRGTITFDQQGGSTLRLTGTDVKAVFNTTQGGQIWLDYLLIVPVEQFIKDFLDIAPIDKSEDFLSMCVDEGFQLRTDLEFCRQGVFTLTTNFNNGALDCNCNPDGSLSFTCDQFGGQCQCKQNIIGRQCSSCRPGYYGFPNCRPCNCPYGLCHEMTGECICPSRVEGERCDRCEPGAYGYDALIGCQQCSCHRDGVQDRDMNCDQITGQCNCKPGVGGRRCDTCLAGYHSFPYCQDCGCDQRGTTDQICDKTTARCLCKDNVVGGRCNRCVDGTYSLSAENPKGCIQCFCFGHTTRCENANLNWEKIENMTGWSSTSASERVQEARNTVRISNNENVVEDDSLYWIAPAPYLGRKINSYGGKLQATILFTLPRERSSEGVIKPDVIIVGNNMTIVHFNDQQPQPSSSFNLEVRLFEYNFKHHKTNNPVSREQFMMILSNIEALHIRASFYSVLGEIRLSNVSLETASERGTGELADSVEICQCPPNYLGLSCEHCAPSYYRARSTPYLGICVKCNCNGHSNDCSVETGECFNCKDGTTGPHCEQCLTGYYGDPTTGSCRICSCPINIASNNFATSCQEDSSGYISSCDCLPGYSGSNCQVCAPGYYGDPMTVGSYCQPCQCNGNIDIRNPNSCDRRTGECLLCENNSGGPGCSMCQDWYWGDAIVRKDCQSCGCQYCGSERCDKASGQCLCKPNVEGDSCERCRPNTWGYDFCDGCRECNCGIGSETQQCDQRTGICHCQLGVEGEKCDRCQANHWNYGPAGCQECDCLHDGATGCDPDTGRCFCLPGVTGEKCDRCLPRWVLVPNRGCQECDYCIHLLLDDLDILSRNVSVVNRQLGEVSIGIGAYNKLYYYNESVSYLRPQAEAARGLKNEDFQKTIDHLKDELQSVSREARNLFGQSESILFEASNLPQDVTNLKEETAKAQRAIQDLNELAKRTFIYIERIRQQLLSTSIDRNIDYFITQGERITTSISAQNFSAQNELAQEGLQNAKLAVEDIKKLQREVSSSFNQTEQLEREIVDAVTRLQDLQNSSTFSVSNAENAINTIRRLKAVHLESLSKSQKIITSLIKEREDDMKAAVDLSEKAQEMLIEAEAAVKGTATESSRLDAAIPELNNKVVSIDDQLANLRDLTNQSLLNAISLVKSSQDLDDMYKSTRGQSQKAVSASKAYKNILDAIKVARNSSNEALNNADIAGDESFKIKNSVSESVENSQSVLNQAEELLQDIQSSLRDKLDETEELLKNGEDAKRDISEKIRSIEDDLKKKTDTDLSERISQVPLRVQNITAAVDEVKQHSDSIISEMSENMAKVNYVLDSKIKIEPLKDDLDSSATKIPLVQKMLNELTSKADESLMKIRNLTFDVTALKEKIARARDEANRIKVGLRFLGNTSITLRNPPNLEDAGSYTKSSLFFKTTQPNALILYIGSNQNINMPVPSDPNSSRTKRSTLRDEPAEVRTRRELAQFQNDFLSLELDDGQVAFTFNLGSGPARILSSRKVNDGKWHQAIMERIGKTGTLTVKSPEKEDEVTIGTSKGTFAVLELNAINTLFLVGGLPDNVKIPEFITTTPFVGGIEDIKFDEEPVGLWNFVKAVNNHEGENQRDFLQEIFTEGVRFNGMGYAVLSRSTLRLRPDRTRVSMSFKTFGERGILFYFGQKDFFSVELVAGRVNFAFDLGGGVTSVQTADTYNDGQWYKITIDRDKRNAILKIDHETKAEQINLESAGSLNNLESSEDVFVGGTGSSQKYTGIIENVGFDGCIKDLVVGTISVDPFDNKRAKGLVRGCAPLIARIVSFPGAGYISTEPVNIGSSFDVTFKVRTLQGNALLMLATDASQSNTFSVALFEGHIVVVEQLGSQVAKLTSRINTYGDGKWHYFSIMKMSQKLSMSIDDAHMTEAEGVSGELLTDSPLYFGGVPSSLTLLSSHIPTTQSIDGCLGDITINEKFKNLASVKKDSRVTLAECAADKVAVEPTVSISPMLEQCALPGTSSNYDLEENEVSAVRFGSHPDSRQEFKDLPIRLTIRPFMGSVAFKTSSQNGVIFYVADLKHVDYVGLHLEAGKVVYGINFGTGAGVVTSSKTYNDDKWHTVKFTRQNQEVILEIDDERIGSASGKGATKTLNTRPPHYVGGLPEDIRKKSAVNLRAGAVGFIGCLKNFAFDNIPLVKPGTETYVEKCSNAEESGTFFGQSGGYITLYDKFRVGKDLDIAIDIRPRSQEGVLLSVHGNGSDFVVLQLSDGAVIFTADNGAGPITVRYVPETRNAICDGQWHSIQAIKNKHILTLTVDGVSVEPQEGKAEVSATDTNDPLYIGGVADLKTRGIVANGDYVGCVRNLRLNNVLQYTATGTPTGDVKLNACPIS